MDMMLHRHFNGEDTGKGLTRTEDLNRETGREYVSDIPSEEQQEMPKRGRKKKATEE